MDAATLNMKLAKALGWKHRSDCVSLLSTDFNGNPFPFSAWVDASGQVQAMKFSPATSADHLRLYVLPEIIRRKCWGAFEIEVDRGAGGNGTRVLLEAPSVLAAAALKVLGGGE